MGVIRLADASMINALKLVSVRRGYDPRDFVLVAFGGGGAMHAAALMRELRVRKVVIPPNASVFSAWGMLMTDLRQDIIRTHVTRTDHIAPEHIEAIYTALEAQAARDLVAQGGTLATLVFQRFADMRYLGQEHTVKVMLPGGVITADAMTEIEQRFHAEHEHTYAFRLSSPVEFVNCHLTAWGGVHKPALRQVPGGEMSLAAAHKGVRRVNFDELGFQDAAIYERDLLPLDVALEGPLVIEEPASTTVVFPGQHIRRDGYGFLHIEPA